MMCLGQPAKRRYAIQSKLATTLHIFILNTSSVMKTQFQPSRYSRNITGARFVFIASLLALLPFRTVHAQDWAYTWVSTDSNPDGFSARIVLDSPASANGSPADILSASFSDNYASLQNFGATSLNGSFSWNPQTITQATLGFYPFMERDPAFIVDPNSIRQDSAGGVYYQDTGYWSGSEMSVPEPSTLSVLAGGTAVVLFLYRRKKAARRRTVNASYTFGTTRLATWNGNAVTLELGDRLGSVRFVTDINGDVIQSYNYDVFGATR